MFKDVLSLPFKLIYIYFSPVSYKTMLMSVLTFLFDAITETESEREKKTFSKIKKNNNNKKNWGRFVLGTLCSGDAL